MEEQGRSGNQVLWALGSPRCRPPSFHPDSDSTVQLELAQVVGGTQIQGLALSPEFCTLLLGLVVYTGSFIAEIVRAGIQAVPKGQWEAARAWGSNLGG